MDSQSSSTSSVDPATEGQDQEPETDVQPGADVSEETAVADGVEASPEQTIQAELEMWKDLALRRQADFDNYRKRVAREKAETSAYANSGLLEQLLPVIDSFEMGLAAARAESSESIIFQGMAMVQRQLAGFLEAQQVTAIDSDSSGSQAFDPSVHEAVGQEASPEVPEGHVLRVQRKGYKLRDRLIRPALVVVSSGTGEGTADVGNH